MGQWVGKSEYGNFQHAMRLLGDFSADPSELADPSEFVSLVNQFFS